MGIRLRWTKTSLGNWQAEYRGYTLSINKDSPIVHALPSQETLKMGYKYSINCEVSSTSLFTVLHDISNINDDINTAIFKCLI